MAFVHATATICQNVLVEKDNVASLIRMADVFTIPMPPEGQTLPPVQMSLWISIRATADDEANHSLAFELVRPNGQTKRFDVFENKPMPHPLGTFATAGLSYKQVVAQGTIGVDPDQLGDHVFQIYFDGDMVAKAFFTLVAKREETPSEPPNSAPLPETDETVH